MDHKPSEFEDKAPQPLYPPPDFSVPPPVIQESAKSIQTAATTKIDSKTSSRESSRHDRQNSRDRERSRHSPPSSRGPRATSSRDYRSQSKYSTATSSRYSSRDYNNSSRRSPERQRESYKRKRSRSRSNSKASSRRSPNYKSTSSRKSPPASHRDREREKERNSRSVSHRHSPKRDTRDARESSKQVSRRSSKDPQTERERLLAKWRKNYCETSEQISKKLQEMASDKEQVSWIRSSPADIFYRRTNGIVVESTSRLDALCTLFNDELLKRSEKIKSTQAPYAAPTRRRKIRVCRHKSEFKNFDQKSTFC